jgi:hypothetical protein
MIIIVLPFILMLLAFNILNERLETLIHGGQTMNMLNTYNFGILDEIWALLQFLKIHRKESHYYLQQKNSNMLHHVTKKFKYATPYIIIV